MLAVAHVSFARSLEAKRQVEGTVVLHPAIANSAVSQQHEAADRAVVRFGFFEWLGVSGAAWKWPT